MERLFYIEKEKFLCEMVTLSLKSNNVDCYTVSDLDQNFYLLKEMDPSVILFDIETVAPYLDELFIFLDACSKDISIIATGGQEEYDNFDIKYKSKLKKFLEKPLSPTGLYETLFTSL